MTSQQMPTCQHKSQQSQQNYVPTNLMTQVQRNQVPGFKQLYTY